MYEDESSFMSSRDWKNATIKFLRQDDEHEYVTLLVNSEEMTMTFDLAALILIK
tara:strand:+ start:1370 stop:1531 length:162 start_codon:yes stop_codon:yes gene_type:complete